MNQQFATSPSPRSNTSPAQSVDPFVSTKILWCRPWQTLHEHVVHLGSTGKSENQHDIIRRSLLNQVLYPLTISPTKAKKLHYRLPITFIFSFDSINNNDLCNRSIVLFIEISMQLIPTLALGSVQSANNECIMHTASEVYNCPCVDRYSKATVLMLILKVQKCTLSW
jgi:hypothetical protein